MRIGVNAVPLRVWGGGARYCFTNLLEAMLSRDDGHEYVIFTHFLGLPVVDELVQVHRHLWPERRARVVEVADEQSVLRHASEFDVYFAPLNNLQPRIYDRPTVAILHDIQEQFFPQFFSKGDLEARNEIYPEICRAATVLVTISEFCKQSIVDKFQIDPGKIEVVYNAPQRSLVGRRDEDVGVWREGPLPDKYVFYPANFYPHKNHATLLDAIRLLREAGSPHTPHVVFTGFEVGGGFRIHEEIAARGLGDLCIVHPKVDEDGLRYLFMHARALIMPTLFEGFGMPAVEALACGCPFISADVPALREVAGDAAVYFPPMDAAAAAAHIERFSAADMRGDARVRRGRERALEFSWKASAERIVRIIEGAPARFLGFDAGKGRRGHDNAPTIALMVLAQQGDMGVPETLKSLWATGYPNLRVELLARHVPLSESCVQLLKDIPIASKFIENGTTDQELLLDLARRTDAQIVGQVWAGNGLTSSSLHSVSKAYLEEPDALVYLGESWISENGVVVDTARLRLRANNWWTLEGYLFPEMIFFRPEALRRALENLRRLPANSHWRWELLKDLRAEDRMCLMRRTLGASRESSISLWKRVKASIDSTLSDGNPLPARLAIMSYAEPVVRVAGKLFPRHIRAQGKRIWEHLKST